MKSFSKVMSVTIAPLSQEPRNVSGTLLKIRSITGSSFPNVMVSFDGDESNPLANGDKYDLARVGGSFSQLTFINNDPVNYVTVVFQAGTIVIDFNNSDIREASTYAKGNLGISSAADITNLFSAQIGHVQTISNGGAGYVIGDILTINGGVSTTAATVKVDNVDSIGRIRHVFILNSGRYTTVPANPNAVTGGTGAGASINFFWTNLVTGLTYVAPNLRLANNSFMPIVGVDGFNRRKQIVFTVDAASASPLLVQDANSKNFDVILQGQKITYFSDSTFIVSPKNATTADFITGETYYNQ